MVTADARSRQRLLKIYAFSMLAILGLVVFHAPLSVGAGVLIGNGLQMLVKAWKELLMVFLLPTAAYLALTAPIGLRRRLLGDKLLWLIGGYAVWHLFLAALFRTPGLQIMSGLAIDLRYFLFFVMSLLAAALVANFRVRAVAVSLVFGAASMVFAFLQVFVLPRDILSYIGYNYQTLIPYLLVDRNEQLVRINGTLRGPNPLGAYSVIVLILALARTLQKGFGSLKTASPLNWLTAILLLTSPVALWSSYSRSALVAGIAAAGLTIAYYLGRRVGFKRLWLTVSLIAVIASAGIYAARNSSFISNVLLHQNPANTLAVNTSNLAHVSSLIEGTRKVLNEPLGGGVGSTGSASLLGSRPFIVENQYLYVAHESGWLGLGMFLAIVAMTLWRLWRRRADWLCLSLLFSGLGLLAIGLLLPVWADDTVSLVWWGLAGAALGSAAGTAGAKKPRGNIKHI